jgi:hypothetical protein
MSTSVMDLAPLLGISRMLNRPSFLLIGLLPIPTIGSVNLMVLLLFLLREPLVLCIKESSLGLRGLNGLICYC